MVTASPRISHRRRSRGKCGAAAASSRPIGRGRMASHTAHTTTNNKNGRGHCITHPFDPQACQSQSVAREAGRPIGLFLAYRDRPPRILVGHFSGLLCPPKPFHPP
eukprot:scaffold2631_cov96-Isochrysis_galbana.AAC.3